MTQYQTKIAIPFLQDAYDTWLKKVEKIAQVKYDLDLKNYLLEYDFISAFQTGTTPREMVEVLAERTA
jgi:hypothetical protein